MRKSFFALMVVMLMGIMLLSGCRQSAEGDSSGINIQLAVDPEPPQTGESTLIVTLTDGQGAPVTNAAVAVRGDMTHAGMEPVTGEASEEGNGVYRVPFEWTMGGDWIVTVTVGLPDGKTTDEAFNFTIPSE